jgi:hypothetical protein
MPRIRIGPQTQPVRTKRGLVEKLVHELKSGRDSGQPIIYEQEFPTGKLRVIVIWDEWDHTPLEERSAAILRAYDIAEGAEFSSRVGLASGLTVPEAYGAGMLPYQIIPALRPGDSVTLKQVRQAMVEEGASVVLDPNEPRLRFKTLEEAEAGKQRLIQRLPGSDLIWTLHNEVADQESFGLS